MIAEKINSATNVLVDVAGRASPDDRYLLSCVQRELRDAAEQAAAMEGYISADMLNEALARASATAGGDVNG